MLVSTALRLGDIKYLILMLEIDHNSHSEETCVLLEIPSMHTWYANVPFTHQAIETLCNLSPFPMNNNSECLPPIEATDLLSYLVLETNFYNKQQFKTYKSLEAYNFMVSGFITSIQGCIVSGKHVVAGKVRHSQCKMGLTGLHDSPAPV